MKVVSTETMRQIESSVNDTIMSYDQMMLNAGRASAMYLLSRLEIKQDTRITLLIGKGNNGGDGLVAAHELAQQCQAQIRLYMLEARPDEDANYQAVVNDGLTIAIAGDDHDKRVLKHMIRSADIIVDALFGIGIRLPLRDDIARILSTVNQNIMSDTESYGDVVSVDPTMPHQLKSQPHPFVFAIDCPSGIDCDTGEADVNTIQANETITFIAAKYGLFTFPAAKYVGKLILSQIGIPDKQTDLTQQPHFVIDNNYVKTHLPDRPVDGHKGTFGKVFIVAGSSNYIGATALSAESAYRSGTGLVTIATITSIIYTIASTLREPTFIHLPNAEGAIAETASETVIEKCQDYDSLLVGCGLGQHETTKAFLSNLLKNENLPSLIVDADGLNILSQVKDWWKRLSSDTIITPHSGEMARLSNSTVEEVNTNRWRFAGEYAKKWNLVVVLKGAHTLIASPDGQIAVTPFKTDALGTAGTGDILAGLIAGLRAQGISAFDSAVVGTYIHALAGTLAVAVVGNSRSVIAGDVLKSIGLSFQQVEED